MVKIRYFVCCETAINDSKTNNISLINTYERFNGKAFPFLIPKLNAIAVFEKNGDKDIQEFQFRISIGKNIFFEKPIILNFRGEKTRRFILEFPEFLVPQPGRMFFKIFDGKKNIATYSIDVEHIQTQSKQSYKTNNPA